MFDSPWTNELASCNLPTEFGQFRLHAMPDLESGRELIALTMGEIGNGLPVLTRLHSECLTGDVFHSLRCDCGSQLKAAMQLIAREGRGAVIYLHQEGRGIGLINKIHAYELQEQGADTVEANELLGFEADLRQYEGAKKILDVLGIASVKLMTNNPKKISALMKLGVQIIDRIPLHVEATLESRNYIATKEKKMGHWPKLDLPPP
jgi:GTP cyclohydrolase II